MTSTPARRRFADDDERQAAQRHRAILDAAASVFLRSGYLGASMDQVAALAGVSKQTVYKHFADKRRLFSEIVTRAVDEAGEPTVNEVMNLRDTGDLEADLCDLAGRLLTRVIQPRLLQLRRLVIGEAERFPAARAYLLRARTGPNPWCTFRGVRSAGHTRDAHVG